MSVASGDTEAFDAPSPASSPFQNTRLQDIARRLDRIELTAANKGDVAFIRSAITGLRISNSNFWLPATGQCLLVCA